MSAELENWTPQQVHEALKRNEIILIDVRTPQEYLLEHIEGALLAPMAFLKAENLPPQDSRRIVLHCGSGVRSGKVGERYLSAGLGGIAHMEGGMAGWKKAGLPYIGTDMSTGSPKRMNSETG